MILARSNPRISKKDIDKIKNIHTGAEYVTFAKCLVHCNNELNALRRQIKPMSTNFNQIAKVINTYKETLYSGSFEQFSFKLKNFNHSVEKMLKLLRIIDKELVKFWQL